MFPARLSQTFSRYHIVISLVFLITSFCPLELLAQDCLDYSDYWHFTGSVWIENTAAVAVAGNYAYVANADESAGGGLHVVDISDLAHPTIVGSIETSGRSQGLVVVGNHVYLANRWRMHIIDVAEPTAPQLIATVDPPSIGARSVAIWGQYAFLAAGSYGVWIYNIADPANPVQVGQFDTPGMALSVLAANNRLYVADGGAGLRIYNLRWPAAPKLMGSVDTGNAHGIAVASPFSGSNLVYVADYESGLVIVDVHRPWQPQILESIATAAGTGCVDVCGRYAYVVNYPGEMEIIDISSSGNHDIHTIPHYPPVAGLTVRNGTVFMVGGGLSILDIGNLGRAEPLASVPMPTSAREFVIRDDHAFVLVGRSVCSLQTVDIADPLNPSPVSLTALPIPTGESTTEIALAGNHAYITHANLNYGQGGLLVVDITDPVDPVPIDDLVTSQGTPLSVCISGDRAYVVDELGLLVADITDPDATEYIGTLETPGIAVDVAIAGNYAYVADSFDGLFVADISVTPPVPVTSVAIPGEVLRVHVKDNRVYAVSDYFGLFIVDITNPEVPLLVGSVDTPGSAPTTLFGGLDVRGSYAYFGDAHGLQIIDVSVATDPYLVGTVTTPFTPVTITLTDDHLWLTNSTYNDNGDLQVFLRQCDGRSTAVDFVSAPLCPFTVYPNPFNPRSTLSFELPKTAQASLELFDLRGQRVNVLLPGTELTAGHHSFTWNGRDERGRDVASGMYFAKLVVDGFEQQVKMVLLR